MCDLYTTFDCCCADDVKMGREYALLGNYDTSLVYYEGACQALKKKVRPPSAQFTYSLAVVSQLPTNHSLHGIAWVASRHQPCCGCAHPPDLHLLPALTDCNMFWIPKAKVGRGTYRSAAAHTCTHTHTDVYTQPKIMVGVHELYSVYGYRRVTCPAGWYRQAHMHAAIAPLTMPTGSLQGHGGVQLPQGH